jgi:hypothetical protein
MSKQQQQQWTRKESSEKCNPFDIILVTKVEGDASHIF